jgi:hypothetical protein
MNQTTHFLSFLDKPQKLYKYILWFSVFQISYLDLQLHDCRIMCLDCVSLYKNIETRV